MELNTKHFIAAIVVALAFEIFIGFAIFAQPVECEESIPTIIKTDCPDIIFPEIDCVEEIEKIVNDLNNIKGMLEEWDI